MSLLTLAEAETYAPFAYDSYGSTPKLQTFLNRADNVAQGPEGANRILSIQQYVQQSNINKSTQTVQFRYNPVIVDSTRLIVVEVRQGNDTNALGIAGPYTSYSSYGSFSGVSEWTVLNTSGNPPGFIIDTPTGILNLFPTGTASANFGSFYYATEARLTYFAGYDFASTTDSDVLKIKYALGALTDYLASSLDRISMIKGKDVTTQFKNFRNSEYPPSIIDVFKAFKPAKFT